MKNTFFLSLLMISCTLSGQDRSEINYTIEDGLPSNNVYCVEQDERGFLWFGTDAGLSRFDGYEFINYTLADGLPDTEILKFYKDSKDRIWMYTLNGQVGYFANDSIYTSRNSTFLSGANLEDRISFIGEVQNGILISSFRGQIHFLSEDGVSILNTNSTYGHVWYCNDELYFQNHETVEGKPVMNLYSLKIEDDVISLHKKLAVFNDYGLRTWQSYLVCNPHFALSSALAPGTHLNYFDLRRLTYEKVEVPFSTYNLKKQNDEILLMTEQGVFRFNQKRTVEKLEGKLRATDLLHDSEGNRWITSLRDGVSFYGRSIVKKVESKLTEIRVLTNIDSTLYIGSKNKISTIDNEGLLTQALSHDRQLSINFIIKKESDFVYGGRGLFLNGIGEKNLLKDKLVREGVFADSTLVIFTQDEIIFFNTSTRPYGQRLSTLHDLDRINDVHIFSLDSFLIASDKGLFLFDDGSYRPFSTNSLYKSRINKIAFDKESNLWVATDGNGLLRFDGDATIQVSRRQGLGSDVCSNLLLTDSHAYVTTPTGISKVQLSDTQDISKISNVDGFKPSKVYAMERFEGKIYFAQEDGIYIINEEESLEESSDFSVFIGQIYVDGIPTHVRRFSSDIGVISIQFKGLSYRNHDNLIYQYSLAKDEESEINWVDSRTNNVSYSDLRYGRYVFKVRARTKNSNWTVPTSFRFVVEPALWETLWFQLVLYGCGILLSLTLYNRLLSNRETKRRLKRGKLEAELKALKAQINPHFLFNALNSIQSFILEDEKNIAQGYLVKYGRLMRKILDHSNELTIPLNEELEALNLYIELEQLRVKQGFDFEVEIHEAVDPYVINVPSMVMQPFLENAIWHGVSKLDEKGKITLKITERDEWIEVEVKDSGVGFDASKSSSEHHKSKGVKLVKERLELLRESAGEQSVVEIKSEVGKGAVVLLRFSNDLS